MNKLSTIETMTLDGGAACLDFVNSGYDRERGVIVERLHNYGDLLTLTGRLELLDLNVLAEMRTDAKEHPAKAAEALLFARKVRTLFYQLFEALSRHPVKKLEAGILAEANSLFKHALQYQVLLNDQDLRFSYQPGPAGLASPVWMFVFSAYEMIRQENLKHIRQCQRCAWLFIDRTKSHRKKWCSMESCGNGQKTRRYYQKKKLTENKKP